ncbi:T9SS type A sorting domain-containing protein [Flavobacterium sp.]|uniref:T9SS type A sorting domain-containing protein n=1 Tax=Flavobacterium sp. TaxID=239 RepID=UPI0039E37F80
MQKITFLILAALCSISLQAQDVERLWGTYFGGRIFEASDSAIDSQGNVYVLGIVYGSALGNNYLSQFASADALQPQFWGGMCDAFLVKFDSDGEVLWSTFFGGDFLEYAYGIAIDSTDSVYIAGTTESNDLATTGAFMIGHDQPGEEQIGFIVKFASDGQRLWSTYFPGWITDIVCDHEDNLYFAGQTERQSGVTSAGAYQENFLSFPLPFTSILAKNGYLAKFNKNGARIWSTYYGGANPLGIDVDADNNLYVAGLAYEPVEDGHFFATENPHQSERSDNFISKFDSNGNRVWSTYFASVSHGEYEKATYTFSLAVEGDYFYMTGYSLENHSGLLTTSGAPQTTISGVSDIFLQKFTNDGTRVWGRLFGGNGEDFIGSFSRLSVRGNSIILSGNTNSSAGLATANAFKTNYSGGTQDSFFARFDSDGNRISTSYYGGSEVELVHGCLQATDDEFYLFGSTFSPDGIATAGSHQPLLNTGGIEVPNAENLYLAKFKTIALGVATFDTADWALYPNPGNGVFVLSGNVPADVQQMQMKIYDNLGREMATDEIHASSLKIHQQFDYSGQLSTGIYWVKIASGTKVLKTIRLMVK